MKKKLLKISLGFGVLFASVSVNAQCPTITCPGNITVDVDPGTCGAVVNYTTPVGEDLCTVSGEVLFVSDNVGGGSEIPGVLTAAGYNVTIVDGDYTGGDNPTLQGSLAAYDIIYWHASGTNYGSTHNAATFSNLDPWITAGGAIFITGYDVIASPTDPELITFMGGTSSSDGGFDGTEVVTGSNSLSTGVTNIVGLALTTTGDHDGLNGLQAGTVGVATTGTSSGWTIRTLGAGEIAWVSSTNSATNPYTAWTTPGSGYNEALLNFAFNHQGLPPTTMIAGLADGSTFPVGTTTVTYEVTDMMGGNATSCSFDVIVNDNEAPVADLASLTDVDACGSASPTAPTATDQCAGALTGTPDVTFPITAAGLTVVTWTYDDGNGNTATQTQNVNVVVVETGVTQAGPMLTSDAVGATYQWIDCDLMADIAGETNQSFTPTATTGNYAVVVTENGCTDTSACTLLDFSGISENDAFGFSIYPNPNNGTFTIEAGNNNLTTIQIFDNAGKLVFETSNILTGKNELNLETLEAGSYIVRLIGEEGVASKTMVIQ